MLARSRTFSFLKHSDTYLFLLFKLYKYVLTTIILIDQDKLIWRDTSNREKAHNKNIDPECITNTFEDLFNKPEEFIFWKKKIQQSCLDYSTMEKKGL